jgi:hypothetical protein
MKLTTGIGINELGSMLPVLTSGGAALSPAALMLADYDDGMAIDWVGGGLAVKDSGEFIYDGAIVDYAPATVTGDISPGSNPYVTVSNLNRVAIDTSGIPLTEGRGTIVQTMYGGWGSYVPVWVGASSLIDVNNGISLLRFGASFTDTRLRLVDAGGTGASAIVAGYDISDENTVFKTGLTWQNAVGARCTVDGVATGTGSAALNITWNQNYIAFGVHLLADTAKIVSTLWLPTYSDEATLASLTS